jgi:HEAT repeat protein
MAARGNEWDWQGVRLDLVAALGNVGDAEAVDTLARLMRHRHFSVKQCVARALGRIGDTRAVQILVSEGLNAHPPLEDGWWRANKTGPNFWGSPDEFDHTLEEVVQAMVQIGTPEALAALEEARTGARSEQARQAAAALL